MPRLVPGCFWIRIWHWPRPERPTIDALRGVRWARCMVCPLVSRISTIPPICRRATAHPFTPSVLQMWIALWSASLKKLAPSLWVKRSPQSLLFWRQALLRTRIARATLRAAPPVAPPLQLPRSRYRWPSAARLTALSSARLPFVGYMALNPPGG